MADLPTPPQGETYSSHAAALHASLVTVDTHIDIPWPPGPDPFEDGPRRVDVPKMRRGGMAAGCFAAYIPQGPRTPEGNAAARDRALAMLDAIAGLDGAQARICTTAAAIEAAKGEGLPAIIPCVENGYAMVRTSPSSPSSGPRAPAT